MNKIVLATGNSGKVKEFRNLVSGVEVLSLKDFASLPAVVEDGATFEANALKKAQAAADFTGLIAVADDSGLEVDYLGGAPGIFSARFAGDSANDVRNNEKLLHLMQGVPKEQRGARFVCALAIVTPDGREVVVKGDCQGYILEQPRGDAGFGYDPLFFYPPLGKTFAEINLAAKNEISHRAKAVDKGLSVLKKLLEGEKG